MQASEVGRRYEHRASRRALAVLLPGALVIGLAVANVGEPATDPVQPQSATVEPETTTTVEPETTTTVEPETTVAAETADGDMQVLVDSPLFVSIDFPTPVVPGSAVTFVVTCSRELIGFESLDLIVINPDGDPVFQSLGRDSAVDGATFSAVWNVPVDADLGTYVLFAACDGPSDAIDPNLIFPDGVDSGEVALVVLSDDLPSTK